jgi:hypothetical protein
MPRRCPVALALLAIGVIGSAQPPIFQTPVQISATQVKTVTVPRINTPPQLEEFSAEHPRADMLHIDDFRQRQPGDGAQVSRGTQAWLGYDDKNLYAVFVCKSPPGQTRARMGKREDIMTDDIVGVFLDTYHDRQRSYEFFVNPLGLQADATEQEGQDDDFSFDTLWYSEGHLTPEGFNILISLPFKSVRFAATDVQTWGIGLGRFIPANNESSFWPYVTQRISGFSPQLATMNGLKNISPSRNLQLIPYGALGHGHFLDDPGTNGAVPVYRTNNDERVGLDAKMILHDSLTLDVALKPDFSQVESDDPQPTVNQRYEVFFNEKRPFFIENSGFFVTPESLFFSRRIIDPDYGARLTGKLGRWNMGVLFTDDKSDGIAVGPADPNYGKKAIIGIARMQREFAKESNIGFLLTDREFAGSYNRVAAVDTRIKLNRNWTLNAQLMASQTQTNPTPGVAAAYSGGNAWNIGLQAGSRHYFYKLTYIDRSEGFTSWLGFIQRVNIREVKQFWNYRFRPEGKKLVSWGPQLNLLGDFDHHNVQQDWEVRPGVLFELPGSTIFVVNHGGAFERFDNINFRRTDTVFYAHSEYLKKVLIDATYSFGTRIDYSTPTGVNAILGRGNEAQVMATFRPIASVKWDEIYDLTRLRTNTTQSIGVFDNHLIRSRINYQYNRELSLRVIVDYNATLPNSALFSVDRQKRVTGDVLLTWLLHPGTAFYLGYTDSLENIALMTGDPNTIVRTNLPATTTQRQFFAKLSYLFRF